MDILTARQLIASEIEQTENKLARLQLEQSILESTFAPDVAAIEAAQKDADDRRLELTDANEQIASLKNELATTSLELELTKADLETARAAGTVPTVPEPPVTETV